MRVGDRIKIKAEDGAKWWGKVVQVETRNEDSASQAGVPGRMETTLTVVLEGPR